MPPRSGGTSASALVLAGFGGGAVLAATGTADAVTGTSRSSSTTGHSGETALTGTTAPRKRQPRSRSTPAPPSSASRPTPTASTRPTSPPRPVTRSPSRSTSPSPSPAPRPAAGTAITMGTQRIPRPAPAEPRAQETDRPDNRCCGGGLAPPLDRHDGTGRSWFTPRRLSVSSPSSRGSVPVRDPLAGVPALLSYTRQVTSPLPGMVQPWDHAPRGIRPARR